MSGNHWHVRLGQSSAWVMTTSYKYGAFFFLYRMCEPGDNKAEAHEGITMFCTPEYATYDQLHLNQVRAEGLNTSLMSLFSSSAARSSSNSSCMGGFMVDGDLGGEKRVGSRAEESRIERTRRVRAWWSGGGAGENKDARLRVRPGVRVASQTRSIHSSRTSHTSR